MCEGWPRCSPSQLRTAEHAGSGCLLIKTRLYDMCSCVDGEMKEGVVGLGVRDLGRLSMPLVQGLNIGTVYKAVTC